MKLQGWVGAKPNRIIGGWIVNKNELADTLLVQVQVKDWKSAPIRADEYREHLKKRGFGDGNYGFTVTIPVNVELSKGDPIIITALDNSCLEVGKLSHKEEISEAFLKTKKTNIEANENSHLNALEALKIVANGAAPARKALKSQSHLVSFAQKVLQQPKLAELLRDAGRALSKTENPDGALKLLNASNLLNPNDNETLFQLAVLKSRQGEVTQAIDGFKNLYHSKWRPARVLSEYAQALRRALESNGHQPSPVLVEELKSIVEARLLLTEVREGALPPSIARTLSRFGFHELALNALEQTLKIYPDRQDNYVAKARTLIESRRVEEGLEVAKAILVRWPNNEAAQHMIRVFRDMRGSATRATRLCKLDILNEAPQLLDENGQFINQPGDNHDLQSTLAYSEADWVVIGRLSSMPSNAVLTSIIHSGSAAGHLNIAPDAALWKASALRDLMESGLVKTPTMMEDLPKAAPFYLRPAPPRNAGTAILISRYGGYKFGGGEHFLHSAAVHYRDMGFRPLILGLNDKLQNMTPPEPNIDGLRYAFIPNDPIALRRLLIEENTTLVHAISGTGFLMAEALGDMNIPFIYGVHYFREVLGGETGEVFFDQQGEPIPRADFAYILSRTSTVYANSRYTQKLLESAHGVRCPIVFSVPEDQ